MGKGSLEHDRWLAIVVSKLHCPGNTNKGYGMAYTLADLYTMSIAEGSA